MAERTKPKAPSRNLRTAESAEREFLSETLSIVVSIFGLIGLGYRAAWTGLLSAGSGDKLTEFVFKLAIPILLFKTLATADFHGVSPWRIWAAYFASAAVVWIVAHNMIRRVFGRDARAGIVAGGSAAYSNGVLIGLPLIQTALGEEGTVFLIVVVAVHLPIMMLISVFLHEWVLALEGTESSAGSRREVFRRLAIAMVLHPILIGMVLGVLWRFTRLDIPSAIAHIIDPLAASAGPLALLASGMALVNYGIARQVRPAVALAALKLLLLPALVYVAATAFGLSPIGVAALTLTASCPTGVNAFLIASRLGTGEALASNTLLISTGAGAVTVTLWLLVMRHTI